MKKWGCIMLGWMFLAVCWSCTGGGYRGAAGYHRVHHRSPWGGFRGHYHRPIVVIPPGGPDHDRPVAEQMPEPPPEPPEAESMPDIGMPEMEMDDIGEIGDDL
jgi:hypothetical protein